MQKQRTSDYSIAKQINNAILYRIYEDPMAKIKKHFLRNKNYETKTNQER